MSLPLIKKWTTLAAVFINVCYVLSYAQSPLDTPDKKKLNIVFLEHLIKTQVDSVRKAHGLRALVNDSILYVAAQDHAIYLSGQQDISHFQKNEQKKTPQNRADFYGAQQYLVGENVLSYPLEATYLVTAQKMVKGWVNSPGHYKNMITPSYQVTGVAIAQHPLNGNIIAVQKFAKVLWKYSFEESKQLFPYSSNSQTVYSKQDNQPQPVSKGEQLPWKLKPLDIRESLQCDKCRNLLMGNLKITPGLTNDGVYAFSDNPQGVLRTFRRRKDGLAVEIVDYEPYHCGNPAYYTNPARRNKNSSIDGEVLKPVYKADLLRRLKKEKRDFYKEKKEKISQLKRNSSKEAKLELETVRKETWEPEYWTSFVSTLPGSSTGYHTYNFLVIHNRAIHLPLYYTDVCGDLKFSDTLTMVADFSKPEISIKTTHKKFTFEIPFERNGIIPDTSLMQSLRDSLAEYRIDTVSLEAFSSVEGFDKVNSTLHKARASAIFSHILPFTDSTTLVNVEAKENWSLFYKQLHNSTFKNWEEWSQLQVKEELQKGEVLAAWERKLSEQRKATIFIQAHSLVKDTLAYVLKNYRIDKPEEARQLQNYLYSLWQQHRISPDSVLKIRYPRYREYSSLLANQLVFDYQLNASNWTKKAENRFFNSFQEAVSIARAGNLLKYNYLVYVINNWHTLQKEKSLSAERIRGTLFQLEESDAYADKLPKLKALFYVQTLPFYWQNRNSKRVKAGLETVFDYYIKQKDLLSSKERTLSLAKYFIELDQLEYVHTILETYYNSSPFDSEIYTYLLKVSFVHPFYQENRNYVRLLMDAKQKLTKEQWCDLFVGPCNITFQLFDDKELRDLYCATCAERGNYATSTLK